jgi:CMP/dCMP kinase
MRVAHANLVDFGSSLAKNGRPCHPSSMIIAVDGPAASGKGTIARALAAQYGLPYLDTGLLYRAVGLAVLRAGGNPVDAAHAVEACDFSAAMLHDPEIRTEAASRAASVVSAHGDVRAALLARQREFAAQPGGAVLDGRDIGTVIAPEAAAKLFVTAAPEIRAQRRFAELEKGGAHIHFDSVLADIVARDARDQGRRSAPLRQANDADLLDTSNLTIDAAVQQAIALVAARLSSRQT